MEDHPRACGEQASSMSRKLLPAGSSPRVRGAVVIGTPIGTSPRIIPARAGSSS